MNDLLAFGWTNEFNEKWVQLRSNGLSPARVVADFGTSLKIAAPQILTAELSGKLAHYSNDEDTPKVGDWVSVRISDNGYAVIEAVISRRSEISRKVTGKRTRKQVIAANIDIAFVLIALDNDFSIERLQRYIYQLTESNIRPVIVLNKADKTDNLQHYTDQLKAFDLSVIITTAITEEGVNDVLSIIRPGNTAILLGSSGAGKSTLTNKLLGHDSQATNALRASDSTGRHTTVHRELFVLPNGGLLVDTPGIRELQLWGSLDSLDQNFEDVLAVARKCRFAGCQHNKERGCAIHDALKNGVLDKSHYANYLKLSGELTQLKARSTSQEQKKNKRSLKSMRRQARDTLDEIEDEMRGVS